ncbi:hypothetical protein GCM10010441_72990 [Kitasatospora paracochleata]|uniref:Uncharacterized membrane protein YidH (DUF202 family) n=1 Tax=Kitasatospora paracochleata TaxID=58354 RepID=A0ABT1J7T3_9ACTN|nr:DUF202 domain-containing protein [Kitasatospora paracochleata]MCP2312776.1 uncharacterized membrane protein YidH (DUF202 family) [Kitasatospora paracochleata]
MTGGRRRDPGLQPERTLLAWSRTALLLAVNALLILRSGLLGQQPGLAALGGVLAGAAAWFHWYGTWRRRRQLGRPSVVGHGPVRAMALVVLLVAAGSAWAVLLGPSPR